MGKPWTEEQSSRLQELLAMHSASHIAKNFVAEIGERTRNSIIGHSNRMGYQMCGKMAARVKMWSSDKLDQLAELYFCPLGYSEDHIAKELNRSVRAVQRGIARLRHREGLQPRGRADSRRGAKGLRKRAYAIAVARDVDSEAVPVTFLELAAGHCRWPAKGWGAEMLYCGASKLPDGPYCPAHFVRATRE